jgi:mRNA interferase MazF
MRGFDVCDVVKVPVPYTNRPVQQFRPALLIACHGNDGSLGLLRVLMITSTAHRRWNGDVDMHDLLVVR